MRSRRCKDYKNNFAHLLINKSDLLNLFVAFDKSDKFNLLTFIFWTSWILKPPESWNLKPSETWNLNPESYNPKKNPSAINNQQSATSADKKSSWTEPVPLFRREFNDLPPPIGFERNRCTMLSETDV